MKFSLKKALAGAATLAVAGGGLLGLASTPALGAPTTPAWEPDPNTAAPYGTIVLYDAAGHVITGGNDLTHLADYAAATTGPDAGATKANLIWANPDHTKNIGTWTTSVASVSYAFPDSTAPAPLTGPAFANPLVHATVAQDDLDLAAAVGGFVPDTTDGYANMIQLRMKDTGPNGVTSGSHYWATDIAYNTGTSAITVNGVTVAPGSWAQVYPVVTTTATTLAEAPPSPQTSTDGTNAPQDVTLTATVSVVSAGTSPGTAGTVEFFDGTTSLGSPVVSSGTASVVAPKPAVGTHSYSAVFTPAGGTQVQGSTSESDTYVVNPPQVGTATSLAGPTTAAQFSPATFTATITVADNSTQAGQVSFDAAGPSPATTSTNLGTVAASNNSATLNLSSVTLSPGAYTVTATFTPTSSSYASSTSQPIDFTVTAAACPGTPVQGQSCTTTAGLQVTVNPGSLTITTPYTADHPFVLPDMALNAAGTVLSSGPAAFPASGDAPILVQSSLAGDPAWTVTVSGTDLTSGSATIDGAGLGLTGGSLDATPVFPHSVTFTDNPAHNPAASPADGNHGVKGGPWTFAASQGGGNGSAGMHGFLTLYAPTQTPAGTYNGTITFAVS